MKKNILLAIFLTNFLLSVVIVFPYKVIASPPDCGTPTVSTAFEPNPEPGFAQNLHLIITNLGKAPYSTKIRVVAAHRALGIDTPISDERTFSNDYPPNTTEIDTTFYIKPLIDQANSSRRTGSSSTSSPADSYDMHIELWNSNNNKPVCTLEVIPIPRLSVISVNNYCSETGLNDKTRIAGKFNRRGQKFILSLVDSDSIIGKGMSDDNGNFDIVTDPIPKFGNLTVKIGSDGFFVNAIIGSFPISVSYAPREKPCPLTGALPSPPPTQTLSNLCQAAGPKEFECSRCLNGLTLGTIGNPKPGAWTAFGCLETTPQGFINWLLPATIGIAGGIAFLLMLWGAFNVVTSTGNPDKLNNGKEIIASAIAGLLMILFSVFLLKLIGVDILGIPGFGG